MSASGSARRLRRTGIRGPRPLEELGGPDFTYPNPPGAWREIRPGGTDPARAAWIELVLADPAAARRERLAQRRDYWQQRLHQHEQRLSEIRAELDQARFPKRDVRAPHPEVTVWQLKCEFAACWADAQAARARLAEVEAELAGLAQA